ncbi:MAG: geranylgeranylglyceryl/heptaprenylglyceryl phosphate synthase [Candidatus Micrarchaeota archaeon]|nr:geranylgeranylglyceryl/heptaprenylglyceryl phosphate synthase [Candidatus Micrarchaeota archaeon]
MESVLKYYQEKMASDGALFFALIDPDKLSGAKGAKAAKDSEAAGADAILVGGSIGAQGKELDDTTALIKENCSLPVILYPGSPAGLTPHADAVYFMQMLNSRDVYWLAGAQIQAAPVVQRMKLEAIPTTYLVLHPGKAVGWMGNANLIPQERGDLAYACALAAKYMGSRVVITDSGSGAPSIPEKPFYAAVKKACGSDVFYFYGGGVKTPAMAEQVISGGADGVQVGNAFEESDMDRMKKLVDAAKKAGKKKI